MTLIRLAAPCLALILTANAQAQEGFTWRTDLSKARALAKTEGKPLLIVFR